MGGTKNLKLLFKTRRRIREHELQNLPQLRSKVLCTIVGGSQSTPSVSSVCADTPLATQLALFTAHSNLPYKEGDSTFYHDKSTIQTETCAWEDRYCCVTAVRYDWTSASKSAVSSRFITYLNVAPIKSLKRVKTNWWDESWSLNYRPISFIACFLEFFEFY